MDEKINFHFPTKILSNEDFLPVDIQVLRNYYRNTFLELIDKVRINIKLRKIGRKRFIQTFIYRSILFWIIKSYTNN